MALVSFFVYQSFIYRYYRFAGVFLLVVVLSTCGDTWFSVARVRSGWCLSGVECGLVVFSWVFYVCASRYFSVI